MTKTRQYLRQIDRLVAKWAARQAEEVEKQSRWPAGAPGGKGGQFAPTSGAGGGSGGKGQKALGFTSMFGPNSTFPGGESPAWAAQQGAAYKPKTPPPGAVPHPHKNDKGQPVTIDYPTKPSDKGSWTDPKRTATFTPGSATPDELNGVPMKPWKAAPRSEAEWANVPGQNPRVDADHPFTPTQGKSVGAGVIIREPDGRIWLTTPTNSFGGYRNTFPKGTVEHGLSMQASAIKEAYEETGLQVRITGVLGDYERTTSKARFYIAERVGGTPAAMGWESQAIRLATAKDMPKLLNMGVDKGILEDLEDEGFFAKAASGKKGGHAGWQKQERWPGGTPLGGQWKAMDANGLTIPPTIAGGLTGSNKAYQKKVDAAYALAQQGQKTAVLDAAIAAEKKVQENTASGAKSTHVKWHAQTAQYLTQLAKDVFAGPKAAAIAERIVGPTKISSLTHAGPKPGGSNPGAVMTDAKGQKWLVKGNNAAPSTGPKVSDDRAKNEVLAAKLTLAAGAGGVDMKLVDMEGQHGAAKSGEGSLGVASKMLDGLTKVDLGNPAHLAAVQKDFAVQAWLGNWDVLGAGLDNTRIDQNGKAVCIDPGGAILFRAQGEPKKAGAFGKDAADFETMRTTDHYQQSIYGKMTKSQLADSAKALAGVSDDTIKELVKSYGPGDDKAKAELADTLIARRDAILAKVGLTKGDALDGAAGAPAAAVEAPAAAPVPPKVIEAVKPASEAGVGAFEKPGFVDSTSTAKVYYNGLADDALAAHAAGDMDALKAVATNKYGKPAWKVTVNSDGTLKGTLNAKLMEEFHSKLVADLQVKQGDAAQAVANGNATVTGKDGTAWKADDKGVLQPEKKSSTGPLGGLHERDVSAIYSATIGANNNPPKGDTSAVIGMYMAAQKGDMAAIEATTPKTVKGQKFKAALSAALAEKLSAQTVAPDAPAAPAAPANVSGKALSSVKVATLGIEAGLVDQVSKNPDAKAAYGSIKDAAKKGDLAGVLSVDVASFGDDFSAFKSNIVSAMGGQPAPAPIADKPDTLFGAASNFAADPLPAAPNFDAKLLPPTNTNAPSHNSKIGTIKALFEAGDEKGLLALNYGTNTYGKKQAEVANDALAALGSVHKVQPGQKTNSHPALIGGSYQTGAPAPKPHKPATDLSDHSWIKLGTGEKVVEVKEQFGVKSALIEVPPKGYDPTAFGTPPDFFTNGSLGETGKWKSSKKEVNEANNAAVQAIFEAATQNGTPEKLKAMTFPLVENGTTKMVGIESHKAAGVKEYFNATLAELEAQLVPTFKTQQSGSMVGSYNAAARAIAASYKAKKYPEFAAHKERAADYLVLSKDAAAAVPVPEKGQFTETGPSKSSFKAFRTASQTAYDAMSSTEKSAAKAYTGTAYDTWNYQLRKGQYDELSGGGQAMVKAFDKVSQELPEGAILWRGLDVGIDSYKSVIGGLIQDGSFNSASYGSKPASIGAAKQTWLRIHVTKGVKGLDATVFSNFGSGEREVIIKNNVRYMVLKAETHSNWVDSDGTSHGKKNIIDVIALPHED